MPYEAVVEEAKSLSADERLSLIVVLASSLKDKKDNAAAVEKKDFRDTYPERFWDLFGSVKDDTFVEPEEIPWEYDVKREWY